MTTSVVMATYNGERFIIPQLESIVSQTVLPTEIVISDDSSSDRTIEIIKKFIDDHVHLPIKFILVHNDSGEHGVVANYENALKHSSGDYLFFCDQDDIWFENKIERILQLFEKTGARVVIHNAQIIKEREEDFFIPIDGYLMVPLRFDHDGLYWFPDDRFLYEAFYRCLIQGMCICAERAYIQSILPCSRGRDVHDAWILFCALADRELVASNEVLCYYRVHSGNTIGIAVFQQKRKLKKRIRSFAEDSKADVINHYIWYKDTSTYRRVSQQERPDVWGSIHFFTETRIRALQHHKIPGTILLLKSYHSGAYNRVDSVCLKHDLFLLWMYSIRQRKELLTGIEKKLRRRP